MDRFRDMWRQAEDIRVEYVLRDSLTDIEIEDFLYERMIEKYGDNDMASYVFMLFMDPQKGCCVCRDKEPCKRCARQVEYLGKFDRYIERLLLFVMDALYAKTWHLRKEDWVQRNEV